MFKRYIKLFLGAVAFSNERKRKHLDEGKSDFKNWINE